MTFTVSVRMEENVESVRASITHSLRAASCALARIFSTRRASVEMSLRSCLVHMSAIARNVFVKLLGSCQIVNKITTFTMSACDNQIPPQNTQKMYLQILTYNFRAIR